MPVKRLCSKPGCFRYRQPGINYCEVHRSLDLGNSWGHKTSDNYNSSKWRRLSKEFLKDNPVCLGCGDPATVVDHIIPHRGDDELFWAEDNWQPLCKRCHDLKTLREINQRK